MIYNKQLHSKIYFLQYLSLHLLHPQNGKRCPNPTTPEYPRELPLQDREAVPEPEGPR